MHDDIFEEDMFEEEAVVSPAHSEDMDEDTQYVVQLMEEALQLSAEALTHIDRLIEINDTFGESITGVNNRTLRDILVVYRDFIPDLILGENIDAMVETTKALLNTTEQVAQDFIDQKRTTLLENVDNSKKK